MKPDRRTASVLIATMLIMSVVTIFTQLLVRSTFVGTYFNRAMIERESAEMLALGGVHLAMAQLADRPVEQRTLTDKKVDKKLAAIKAFLRRVLPHLNRWQEFELKKEIDGVDGLIKFCITCESGKINLNEAFDFKKGQFKKDISMLLKSLVTRSNKSPGAVMKKLTDFLRTRQMKLRDITQLLEVETLGMSNIFYKPPEPARGKAKARPNVTVFLQDLFTISSKTEKINPLLFSDSMCAVLGLRRPMAHDAEKIADKMKQVIDNFSLEWGKNWDENWKFLNIIYDAKPSIFKQIKGLFSQEFVPRIYSVLCCGKVGDVEQYLVALIEKNEEAQSMKQASSTQEKDEMEAEKAFQKPFTIKKLYWL